MFIDRQFQCGEDEVLRRHAIGLRLFPRDPDERALVPSHRALVGRPLESHGGAHRPRLAERLQRRIPGLHFSQQAIPQHTVGVPAVVRHDHEIRPQAARKPQVPGCLRIRLAGRKQHALMGTRAQQVFAELFEHGRQPQPFGERVPGERGSRGSGRFPVDVRPFPERIHAVHSRRVGGARAVSSVACAHTVSTVIGFLCA